MLLLGLPPVARGQVDSLGPPAPVAEAPSPTPSRRTPPIAQRSRFDQPRWVMMRSLVVPGWGQAHNQAWFKAAGVAVGELALIKAIVNDERELSRLTEVIDLAEQAGDEAAFNQAVEAYNQRLSDSISRRWFLGTLIAYAMVDAYVDAHFTHFDVEFGPDPALPEGSPSSPGGRISLRWTF